MKTVKALRGAACSSNTPEDMALAVTELYDELLRRNGLEEKALVSLCFSVTKDLCALNPAAALRRSGRAGETALMVFQEAAFADSLPRTIRALAHCYMEGPVRHVYIRGAEVLRPDRVLPG